MKYFIQCISITLLCCTTFFAYGEQLQISHTSVTKLLDHQLVNHIFKDSRGILWVGTQDGLYRFDGAKLTVFNSDSDNKNRIATSEIRSVAEDHQGRILVATNNRGLLRWNKQLGKFESVTASGAMSELEIRLVHVGNDGLIWLGGGETTFLFDPNLDSAPNWLQEQDIASKVGRPYAFLEDNFGNILIGGSRGLAVVTPKNQVVRKVDLERFEDIRNNAITAMTFDGSKNLVLGTDKGHVAIIDLDLGKLLHTLNVDKNATKFISQLLYYQERLLIGSDNGLYISDPNLKDSAPIRSFQSELSNNDIYELYKDGRNVWIGTYSGLDILSIGLFELFNQKNSGVYDDVLAIEEDKFEKLWIATYSGLYFYNKELRYHSRYFVKSGSPKLIDQRISAIATKGNHLWLGFYQGGVQVINLTTGASLIPNLGQAKRARVSHIFSDPSSPYVWISTYDYGLFRIEGEIAISYYENGALPAKDIEFVFKSPNGNLYATSHNQFYEYNSASDSFSPLTFDFGESLYRPRVHSVGIGRNGDVWFGSKDQGLYLWSLSNQVARNFKLEKIGVDTKLEFLTIYSIEEDLQGNLWCSTQSGIIKLDPYGKLIQVFSTTDGLQGNDFGIGASLAGKDGYIYFGGANGYNKFNPNDIEIDRSPSGMLLTDVFTNGSQSKSKGATNNIKSLQLTHSDRFITFQFSVLDLIHPEKNQFRYMLENFDTEWIDNGNRNTATYTNLAPGDYVFRVQGANSAGVWNYDGLSLDLHVLPPLWRTWWAYCLYSLAFLFATWGAHRIYYSYVIHRHSIELAKEMFDAENRADDDMQEQIELQDELVQSAYSHNLANLSLVRECLSQRVDSNTDAAVIEYKDENLKRIAALARLEDCLFYRAGGPVADLHKYTDSVITMLLPDAKVSPESIITINEIPSRLIPGEVASPLAIVLYELLENTIEHAFEEGSLANYLHITLESRKSESSHGREFQLCVRDSGGGFTATIEELLELNSGLSIVKAITDRLDGELQVSTSSGTKVTVTIPEPAPWNPPTNSYTI